MKTIYILILLIPSLLSSNPIQLGIDQLLQTYPQLIKNKKVGLITNHTAINSELKHTQNLLLENEQSLNMQLVAIFSPEHGFNGAIPSWEKVKDSKTKQSIPIYSLFGKTRRPTKEMLDGIDILIFDIMDIGSRSYTYITTLFYCMEEAAKYNIPVIVTDRPNPMGGIIVDGPMLEEEWRSFVGYINVPYCHGMTVGELAQYFNKEYKVQCQLYVIKMNGWKRNMLFKDTELPWTPTSPHIPEPDTPLFYPTTGLLGELQILSIGIGYTLPFKIVGAPWLNADLFAKHLNAQRFPGVKFQPFHFRPYYGRFAKKDCHGVLIIIDDPHSYLPVSTQYLIIGILKSLYPLQFSEALEKSSHRLEMFHKVNGTKKIFNIIANDTYIVWKLKQFDEKPRKKWKKKRKPYLLYN